jgi:hypothetical protein
MLLNFEAQKKLSKKLNQICSPFLVVAKYTKIRTQLLTEKKRNERNRKKCQNFLPELELVVTLFLHQ